MRDPLSCKGCTPVARLSFLATSTSNHPHPFLEILPFYKIPSAVLLHARASNSCAMFVIFSSMMTRAHSLCSGLTLMLAAFR